MPLPPVKRAKKAPAPGQQRTLSSFFGAAQAAPPAAAAESGAAAAAVHPPAPAGDSQESQATPLSGSPPAAPPPLPAKPPAAAPAAAEPPPGPQKEGGGAAVGPDALQEDASAAEQSKAAAARPPIEGASEEVNKLLAGLLDAGWREALSPEFRKPYFDGIAEFLAKQRRKHTVFPPEADVFAAFNYTPLEKVRVVIIGQDPYHDVGQAHGLCFSVLPGVRPPPSLKNIYKELAQDIDGFAAPPHGCLIPWARQGVLLLNATLTVTAHQANSHKDCGWQKFTDAVIAHLSARCKDVVFLLWGGFAQKKGKIIDRSRHVVLETAHPSPLSVTKWRNCKVFSKCNEELRKLGKGEVLWALDDTPDTAPPEAPGAGTGVTCDGIPISRCLSARGLAAAMPLPGTPDAPSSSTPAAAAAAEGIERVPSVRSCAAATPLPEDDPAAAAPAAEGRKRKRSASPAAMP